MPSRSGIARQLARALTNRFEGRKRIARAVITSLQTDSTDRVIGATASVDGLSAQRIHIDHGSNLQVGDVLEVLNRGGTAGPAWYALRRVRTTIPVPTLPYGTTLPVPLGLSLSTGLEFSEHGQLMAYVYATFYLLPSSWGQVSYQIQYRTDDDDPITITIPDPAAFATLVGGITASDTVAPRTPGWDYDYPKEGVIKIESEEIAYTAATRKNGVWLYPYSVQSLSFHLWDYVEDAFTDTDTTDIVSHTPDYDRYSGGWYVIPTYSSNWAISSNKVAATPGGTWPYSAAIIDTMATTWGRCRLRGDWTWPSSGQFGYIADYVDASNFVYIRYDMTSQQFEVVERIAASDYTVWTQGEVRLNSAQTYTFEVNVVEKEIHIRISGGDLQDDIEYSSGDVLTNDAEEPSFGIWSDVAVTLDNFYLDDARERELENYEWIDFVYHVTGFSWARITNNEYSAAAHMHSFTTNDDPGATGGSTYPAFTGLTRGYNNTTAVAHSAGTGIYSQKQGVMISGLPQSTTYNVRVRAYLNESVVSPWSDWSTIQSTTDTTPPSDPTGFTALSGVGQFRFSWTGPTLETVRDLQGFEIYKATADDGTGAALYATTSLVTSLTVEDDAGEYGYFNIKAVDTSGNKSDYGEATWILAASGYDTGGQIATNTDFEVGTSYPLYFQMWGTQGSYPTLTYESSGGYGGGKCFKAVLATSVPATSVRNACWATLTESVDIPGIYPALYRMSAYIKPSGGLTIQDIIDNSYFYFQLSSSDGSNFAACTQPLVSEGYYYIGDGWYRYWQDRLWLNSSYATYPYLAFYMMWHQAAGSHDSGEFLVDRVQLELGPNMTHWGLNTTWVGGDTGVRVDTSGLLSDGLIVDADGNIGSDFDPDSDDARDLGGSSRWNDIRYGGDLKVTRSSVEYTGQLPETFNTPLTHDDFNGDPFSDVVSFTKIENTGWSTAIPADAKALLIRVMCRDSGSAGTSGLYVILSGDGTNGVIGVRPSGKPNDDPDERTSWMPCTNGDIWYRVEASGTGTMDIWLYCFGYML